MSQLGYVFSITLNCTILFSVHCVFFFILAMSAWRCESVLLIQSTPWTVNIPKLFAKTNLAKSRRDSLRLVTYWFKCWIGLMEAVFDHSFHRPMKKRKSIFLSPWEKPTQQKDSINPHDSQCVRLCHRRIYSPFLRTDQTRCGVTEDTVQDRSHLKHHFTVHYPPLCQRRWHRKSTTDKARLWHGVLNLTRSFKHKPQPNRELEPRYREGFCTSRRLPSRPHEPSECTWSLEKC